MKIVFLVVKNINRGGGIEKYTLELGRRLVERGHEVTVYSMRHYGENISNIYGMNIVYVPSIPLAFMQKLSAAFVAAGLVSLRESGSIIHLHSVAAGAFGWLAKLGGNKCLLQMHGIEWKRKRWGWFGSVVLKMIEKIALMQSGARTAVSKTQCEFYLKRGIEMQYISTATNIKPPTPPQKILKLGLKPDRYILFASRLVREKGAHYLLSAFKRLDTDMHLVIAGDAPGSNAYKRELLNIAKEDSRILFTGYVEGKLLDELFSNAYLYVHPSEIEGLSIALLEAMSYGLCCLASDIPENKEALNSSGLYFKSANVDDLTRQLSILLRNPAQVEIAGIKAIHRVKRLFSWESVVDQIEEMYEKCFTAEP